jgi:hypothetical protein
MNKTKAQKKRCMYCGRYFIPDIRVGAKQKACKDKACQAKRKKASQGRWLESNSGYLAGRYDFVKQWRKEHPDYQRQWRAKRREIQDEIHPTKPIRTIRLVIPAEWFKGEIQDEIRLKRQCGCGFFVAGGGMRDTRSDCKISKASLP